MPYSPMELAQAFLKTGEIEDALDALNQQLEQHPDDDHARRLRIQVMLRLGGKDNFQAALTDHAALSSPTAEDYQAASILQQRLGNIEAAIHTMRQARELAPDDERLTERLLELLIVHQAYDDALALIRRQKQTWRWLERAGDLLVLMNDDTTATARYGLALTQLEQFAGQMRKDYLDALKARILLARAQAYRRLEHLDSAFEHYQAAKNLLPQDDPVIDFNLGMLTFLQGDLEAAAAQCQAALGRASSHLANSMLESLQSDDLYQPLLELLLKSN